MPDPAQANFNFHDLHDMPSTQETTPEGYLKVTAKISRTGLQTYNAEDILPAGEGLCTLYRSQEEVFDLASIKSFNEKPVTNDHPSETVGVRNYAEIAKGTSLSDTHVSGKFLETTLLITDLTLIDDIREGKMAISCGYSSKVVMQEGIHDGIPYDGVQTEILGNHIAVVVKGRAGSDCRIADTANPLILPKEAEMPDNNNPPAVNAEMLDKANDLAKTLQDNLDKVTAERDAFKEKLETAPAEVETQVQARLAIMADALTLDPTLPLVALTNEQIVDKVLEKFCPKPLSDNAVYKKARFDILVEDKKLDLEKALVKNADVVTDTRPLDVIAREALINRNKEIK